VRKLDFLLALLLLSVLTNAFNIQLSSANPETIIVPDTYLSIQEAINHAKPGETIYVKAGVYLEHIVIGKNDLKIVGENKSTTIIDGQRTGTVVYVKANGTVFSSFTIKNSGFNFTDSGIYIDHSLTANISGNNVLDSNLGIYLYASSNIILRNNNMTANRYNFGVYGDNLQSYVHDIDASNMVDSKPLIYWINQTDKQPPADAGYVTIVNSTNITLRDLTLSRNWQTVLFAYSTNSNIRNVTGTRNMDCIWLLNCSGCSVMDSTISDNSWGGIALVDSSACSVYDNNVNNNFGYGVFLSNASDNVFYHNNFINNTQQILLFGFNSNNWDGDYPSGGNFWSNHTGVDEKRGNSQNQSGSDGICDTPFIIDSNNTDRYPLMAPWNGHSQSATADLILCVTIGIVILLITSCIILYLVKTRKQPSSIQSLRLITYKRDYFKLFPLERSEAVAE
jgi:parallel beta-helix repeat protein